MAKTFAHYTCVNYRESYGIHASSGILFNHEGENRGFEFVTRKITSNIAKIKCDLQERFTLGDLSPLRDWGYAGDYVEAMWLMLQQDEPDDFVIATGVTNSVGDFLKKAIEAAELKGDLEDYIDIDSELIRPSEVQVLCGDASKAKNVLDWTPKVDFDNLVQLMVENDLKMIKENS